MQRNFISAKITLTGSEASGFPDSSAGQEPEGSAESAPDRALGRRAAAGRGGHPKAAAPPPRLCPAAAGDFVYPLASPRPAIGHQTASTEKRAALLPFTSRLHTGFRAPGDPPATNRLRKSPLRALHRPGKHEGTLWRPPRGAAGRREPFGGEGGGRGTDCAPAEFGEKTARLPQPVRRAGSGPKPPPAPATPHSPERRGSRQQLSASPERARAAARAGGSMGSGRPGAAGAERVGAGRAEREARGAEALQHVCPVTAPRRGAEWQMRDPITSHVTGKDRDPHPNLPPGRAAAPPPSPSAPAGLGGRCWPRGRPGGSAEPLSEAAARRHPPQPAPAPGSTAPAAPRGGLSALPSPARAPPPGRGLPGVLPAGGGRPGSPRLWDGGAQEGERGAERERHKLPRTSRHLSAGDARPAGHQRAETHSR